MPSKRAAAALAAKRISAEQQRDSEGKAEAYNSEDDEDYRADAAADSGDDDEEEDGSESDSGTAGRSGSKWGTCGSDLLLLRRYSFQSDCLTLVPRQRKEPRPSSKADGWLLISECASHAASASFIFFSFFLLSSFFFIMIVPP